MVEKPGYTVDPDLPNNSSTSPKPDPAHFTMVPAGNLVGRLVDRNGKGVLSATLFLSGGEWRRVRTDRQGHFTARDIAPGKYELWIDEESPVTALALSGIEVKVGETARAPDMQAIPAATLAGQMLDADTKKPVEYGYIYVTGKMSPHGSSYSIRQEDEGRYRFRVYPGQVRLSYTGNSADSQERELTVPSYGLAGVDLYVKRSE